MICSSLAISGLERACFSILLPVVVLLFALCVRLKFVVSWQVFPNLFVFVCVCVCVAPCFCNTPGSTEQDKALQASLEYCHSVSKEFGPVQMVSTEMMSFSETPEIVFTARRTTRLSSGHCASMANSSSRCCMWMS